jgi:hypothetical protein
MSGAKADMVRQRWKEGMKKVKDGSERRKNLKDNTTDVMLGRTRFE